MRETKDTVTYEKVSDINKARTREWWRWEEETELRGKKMERGRKREENENPLQEMNAACIIELNEKKLN